MSVKTKRSDRSIIHFHSVINAPLVSGSIVNQISPSGLTGRALTEADAWAHFRVLRLRFRLLPSSSVTGTQAIGYTGGIQDSTPVSVAQLGELIPSTVLGATQTTPTKWVTVPKADLAGPLPWYKSINGSADVTEEAPGVISISGSGTDTVLAELFYTFEFKTAVAASNTPAAVNLLQSIRAERLLLAREREREVIKQVLGGDPVLVPLNAEPRAKLGNSVGVTEVPALRQPGKYA